MNQNQSNEKKKEKKSIYNDKEQITIKKKSESIKKGTALQQQQTNFLLENVQIMNINGRKAANKQ